MAVWFHDVIYNLEIKDNEEMSARYAQDQLRSLGFNANIIDYVIVLIKATAKHEIVKNVSDSKIFLDADLAILGSSPLVYDDYALKIRKEYSWISDKEYRVGRKNILKNFLKRSRIYFSKNVFKKFEFIARNNIVREIETLDK